MRFFANIFKNIKIGKNNYIEKNVKIYENVIIGNNNKIYDGTIIYPNTIIGNNNIILNNNIIGEHGVEARQNYVNKVFNGVLIGNNNFLHVNNIISNGYFHKTILGNNNKLLSETHISHDTNITNNVVLYPRAITAGLTTLLPYSTMGMNSSIQQNTTLGQYAMIGMGNISSHNVFPFFIYANNKYLRLNTYKLPKDLNIEIYEDELLKVINNLKNNNFSKETLLNNNLPDNINKYLIEFYDTIKIKKI